MKGTYKVEIELAKQEKIVNQLFGVSLAESRELTDGWANAAYEIKLTDGRKVVLKAAPLPDVKMMRYERNLMRAEVEVMRSVRDLGTVPVPAIYGHDDSRSLVPVEYFVMEFIEGEPYSKRKNEMETEQRKKVERELGRYNRRINELKGSRFGLYADEASQSDSWKEAFGSMIESVLLDGEDEGVELPADYDEMRRQIAKALPALEEVKEPRLAHWDLWDGNVFVKDGRITGIIDFERAMWADPLIEHYFSHFNGTQAFYEGYGQASLTREEKLRRSLYDLHLDLILRIECAYRQYEDPVHIEWTKRNAAEGWERFLTTLSLAE